MSPQIPTEVSVPERCLGLPSCDRARRLRA